MYLFSQVLPWAGKQHSVEELRQDLKEDWRVKEERQREWGGNRATRCWWGGVQGFVPSLGSCRQVHGRGGWGAWTGSLEMRVSRNIKELYGRPYEQWWLWEPNQRGDRCRNLGRWLKVSIMVLRSGWRNCISHSAISIRPPKVIQIVAVVMVGKISTCTRDHCCVVG